MVWKIIFFICGGILGWVLYAADIRVNDWPLWAILLTTALSQFAIANMAISNFRKKQEENVIKNLKELYQYLLDLNESDIPEVENDE